MVPTIPSPAGLTPLPSPGAAKLSMGPMGWCELHLDAKTGAIIHLSKKGEAGSLAALDSPLLLLRYQTLVAADFAAWQVAVGPTCHSAAPSSPFGRRINRDGEGVRRQNDSLADGYLAG